MYCDHTVDFSTDLSLWLDSPMFWAPRHQSMSTYTRNRLSPVPRKREVLNCVYKLGEALNANNDTCK